MKLSVIVPVKNEEKNIPFLVERLKKNSSLCELEIIIVDGGSQDQSLHQAQQWGTLALLCPTMGRAAQMHYGAQKASGEIFIFLHADTDLPLNWTEIIEKRFVQESLHFSAAVFSLGFDEDSWKFKLIVCLAGLRSKITGVHHGDQSLIVTRENYFKCGGFPEVVLMEEYFIFPALRKLGAVRVYSEKVCTSARKYLRQGPLRNALKNSFYIVSFYLGISPKKIAKWY